jgi:hypothetical protein
MSGTKSGSSLEREFRSPTIYTSPQGLYFLISVFKCAEKTYLNNDKLTNPTYLFLSESILKHFNSIEGAIE